MRVGVLKEIKVHEYRVGITPEAARDYAAHGHEVLVETNAGMGMGASDADYVAAGATIAANAAEVFAKAQMIVKVKEPQPSEWVQLREGQILFTYLHLAPDPRQAEGLMASGCTAVAYETVVGPDGSLPLLAPMSEVAGRLSIEAAGMALAETERRTRHSLGRRSRRDAGPRRHSRRRCRRHASGAHGGRPWRRSHRARPLAAAAAPA